MSLYAVKDKFKGDILSGMYGSESRIPSFRSLAQKYDCSFATIKRFVDELQEDGLLVSIHGKGTFLSSATLHPKRRQSRIIGTILLEDPSMKAVEMLKGEWLAKGWFLSIYNASSSLQNPEEEREFLEMAERERFAGVAMVPTPKEPSNTRTFARLKVEGLKIALLGCYATVMPGETYFLADYKAAGALAVSQSAMRGYRGIAYVDTPANSPFKVLQALGIGECASSLGLKLLPPVKCLNWGESHYRDVQEIGKLLMGLPPNTAVLCSQSDLADAVYKALLEYGRRIPDDIGVISLYGGAGDFGQISQVGFGYEEILRAALEYISDGKRSSMDIVQKLFPPFFLEGETIRKA